MFKVHLQLLMQHCQKLRKYEEAAWRTKKERAGVKEVMEVATSRCKLSPRGKKLDGWIFITYIDWGILSSSCQAKRHENQPALSRISPNIWVLKSGGQKNFSFSELILYEPDFRIYWIFRWNNYNRNSIYLLFFILNFYIFQNISFGFTHLVL